MFDFEMTAYEKTICKDETKTIKDTLIYLNDDIEQGNKNNVVEELCALENAIKVIYNTIQEY